MKRGRKKVSIKKMEAKYKAAIQEREDEIKRLSKTIYSFECLLSPFAYLVAQTNYSLSCTASNFSFHGGLDILKQLIQRSRDQEVRLSETNRMNETLVGLLEASITGTRKEQKEQ